MKLERRSILLALAVAAGGLAIWFSGPVVLRRVGFFKVRRVELVGATSSRPADLIAAMKIPSRANIFDPLEPYQARVYAVPGIQRAEVHRRLPGTLVVTVTERPAVALTPKDGRLALLGANGKVLPFDPTVSAPDLPVVSEPDARVARVLGRLQEVDPELFSRVVTATQVRGDVVVDVGGRRLWLRPDVTAEVIRAVMAAEQVLSQEGRAWKELDGRFAGQVVVRGRGRAG